MYLVIAEKPSVSRAIAEVIGAQEREDGYLQGTDCMVSWCFGHLAEYVSPDAYDEKFNQWRYEDLPIIPKDWKVTVSEDKKDQFYILKRLLNSPEIEYGVTQEQIHEDAMKSSPRVMVPEVSSIGVLIDEIYQKNILMLTPDEREMLLETLQESSEMPTFFVVTNTERIDGAGVIFYPEFMDNMGELLGNDFFILPSSIHQMLILPDDGQVDAEMLRDMVKEVNATQVAPAERLTNDVYHFDTKDHVFEKADRFTERQKEKEAQVAKTEKVGKEQPDQKPKTKKHDMEL